MALRDLFVHLDSSARCRARLDLAVALARRHDARLVGFHAETAPAQRVGVVAAWPSAEYLAAAEASRAVFAAATAGLGDRALFQDANRGGEAEVIARVVEAARTADMVILGQSDGEAVRVPDDLPERVVLESGRPVLMVPSNGIWADVGHRPMFAWTSARAAARALADGIALVAPGADAAVVQAASGEAPLEEAAERVIAHLTAHGIAARHQSVVVEEVRLMDTLLNRAADHAADLMIIGAFENAGFPFVGRGSGTRYVLRHLTLPVLFSH